MKKYRTAIRTLLSRTQLPCAFQRAINAKARLTIKGQKRTPDIEEYRDTAMLVLVIGMVITVVIRWFGLALIFLSVAVYSYGMIKHIQRFVSHCRSAKIPQWIQSFFKMSLANTTAATAKRNATTAQVQ